MTARPLCELKDCPRPAAKVIELTVGLHAKEGFKTRPMKICQGCYYLVTKGKHEQVSIGYCLNQEKKA